MPVSHPCSQPCTHLPACHRCARPGRRKCSAHISSCGGPSSPRTRRPHAAGCPSSDPRCRVACIGTPRFPRARTLHALSQGKLWGHQSEYLRLPSPLLPVLALPVGLATKNARHSLAVCFNKSIYLGGVYETLFPFCSEVEI